MSNPSKHFICLAELNEQFKPLKIIALNANSNPKIATLNTLKDARCEDLSFCQSAKFLEDLHQSKASIVLVSAEVCEAYRQKYGKPSHYQLVFNNPRLVFDKLCLILYPPKSAFIHPKAIIHSSAIIGQNARIEGSVAIGENVVIGKNALIYPNVSIYDNVIIGDDVIIHGGTTIGSDGFGFDLVDGKAHKQPQIGSVMIGNRVEIGANCSIDRGTIGNTVLQDEVKLDNLVHIAHNVKIGSQTAIMGSCGIAGGAQIGKRCQMFGMVAINGYISIADGVRVLGHSTVTSSIKNSGSTWASTSVAQEVSQWRRNAILSTRLTLMDRQIKALEKQINEQ